MMAQRSKETVFGPAAVLTVNVAFDGAGIPMILPFSDWGLKTSLFKPIAADSSLNSSRVYLNFLSGVPDVVVADNSISFHAAHFTVVSFLFCCLLFSRSFHEGVRTTGLLHQHLISANVPRLVHHILLFPNKVAEILVLDLDVVGIDECLVVDNLVSPLVDVEVVEKWRRGRGQVHVQHFCFVTTTKKL